MTLEEKSKIIKENKEKNYLYISPKTIEGGATLISNYDTLELYENMINNTVKVAEREIVNLMSNAQSENQEARNYLDFNLIFCGDFDDLPEDMGSFADFIMNNRKYIVAVYRYVTGSQRRHFFVGFDQTETINNYDYLYLYFDKLLEMFEENNVKFEIETNENSISSIYRDNTSTRFVISYTPNLKIGCNRAPQLKKTRE